MQDELSGPPRTSPESAGFQNLLLRTLKLKSITVVYTVPVQYRLLSAALRNSMALDHDFNHGTQLIGHQLRGLVPAPLDAGHRHSHQG